MADDTKPDAPTAAASLGGAAPAPCRPAPRRGAPARRSPRPRPAAGRAGSGFRRQDDDRGVGRRRSRHGGSDAGASRPLPPRPAIRRHLAAAHAPRLDRPGLGRLLGRLGRGAGGHRPLHVPERAQRAAAAVQGRLPERVRRWAWTSAGRRSSASGSSGRPTTSCSTPAGSTRLLVTCTHLGCTPNYLSAESKFKCPVPRQRLPHDRHQLRGPGAASARARAHRAGRRRPDPGRQEPKVPVRARTVGRSGSVSQVKLGLSDLQGCMA